MEQQLNNELKGSSLRGDKTGGFRKWLGQTEKSDRRRFGEVFSDEKKVLEYFSNDIKILSGDKPNIFLKLEFSSF